MDFGFSEEQEMLRELGARLPRQGSPMTYVRQMMEDDRGLLRRAVEEDGRARLDGPDLPARSTAAPASTWSTWSSCSRRWGGSCCPGRSSRPCILGGCRLLEAAATRRRRRYLPQLAAGELKATLAQLEASGRWDADGIPLEATAGRRRLHALRHQALRARRAHRRPARRRGAHGSGQRRGRDHAVPRRRQGKGVTVTLLKTMDQTRKLCEVKLDQVRIGPRSACSAAPARAGRCSTASSTAPRSASAPRCAAARRGCSR